MFGPALKKSKQPSMLRRARMISLEKYQSVIRFNSQEIRKEALRIGRDPSIVCQSSVQSFHCTTSLPSEGWANKTYILQVT